MATKAGPNKENHEEVQAVTQKVQNHNNAGGDDVRKSDKGIKPKIDFLARNKALFTKTTSSRDSVRPKTAPSLTKGKLQPKYGSHRPKSALNNSGKNDSTNDESCSDSKKPIDRIKVGSKLSKSSIFGARPKVKSTKSLSKASDVIVNKKAAVLKSEEDDLITKLFKRNIVQVKKKKKKQNFFKNFFLGL